MSDDETTPDATPPKGRGKRRGHPARKTAPKAASTVASEPPPEVRRAAVLHGLSYQQFLDLHEDVDKAVKQIEDTGRCRESH